MQKSILHFYGGAEHVTGANFLLQMPDDKVIFDCGLVQGSHFISKLNHKKFNDNIKSASKLFISHAHMDHIGRIPKLFKEGFEGKIYSTRATKDMAPHMFEDAYKIMLQEEKIYKVKPIYDMQDVQVTLESWETFDYGDTLDFDSYSITAKNAGHILGSAMFFLDKDGKRFVYTGDLGNTDDPLLPKRDKIENANFILMESVYGDRLHEGKKHRKEILKRIIQEAQEYNKTILIPSFSLERAQAIIYEINSLVEDKELEPISVFLDSPLAIKLTKLFYKYKDLFNETVQNRIKQGDNIFDFPHFSFVETPQESASLVKIKGPKIIIAGSGMSTGGRVLSHEKHYLEDPNAGIVFVGYQAAGTIGRKIQEGVKELKIENSFVKVRAKVYTIKGYSAHADRDELMSVVQESVDTLEELFVAMGELKSSLFFAQRAHEYFAVKAHVASLGESYNIDF